MVESKTTTGVVTGGGQGAFSGAGKTQTTNASQAQKPSPKAAAKPEPAEKPWHPAFPPPGDGNYEVKWSDDEIVKATRRNGVWSLPDGRSIHVHEWR